MGCFPYLHPICEVGGGQMCGINNEVKTKKVGFFNYLHKMTYVNLKLSVWK
jgi:hypothetical protein